MGAVEITLAYEPRKAFIAFHNRSKRWACIVAHRRAGKTVAACNDLIIGALECRHPRPQYAYIAPFLRQAKSVAWDYLKHYSEPLWKDKPNESELRIELINGSRLMVFGADNADALRGLYLDGVFLDEFGDFKPSVWGNVIRPALSDRKGWAVFGGTPKGRNEFWEVREKARVNPGDWYLQELRASESGILDPDEVEDARKQLTPEQFLQEFECDFAAALPGAYFGRELVACEREGRICEVDHDPNAPVFTAWDIGYRDDTAIWFYQVIGSEIHVIDYHASSGQTIGFYTKLVKEKNYKYKTHWLPHDAKARTLASGGKSIVEQLAAGLGINSLAIVPDLDVQDGIQAARLAINKTWFDEKSCYEGLEALRQYQREWDEDKKAFRERPRHDWTSHPADAYRMLAVAWKQEEPKPQPDRVRSLIVGQTTETLEDAWKYHERQHGRTQRI